MQARAPRYMFAGKAVSEEAAVAFMEGLLARWRGELVNIGKSIEFEGVKLVDEHRGLDLEEVTFTGDDEVPEKDEVS